MCSHSSDKEFLLVCKVLLGHRYGVGGGDVKRGSAVAVENLRSLRLLWGEGGSPGLLGRVLGAPWPLWGASEPAVHRAGALDMSHL